MHIQRVFFLDIDRHSVLYVRAGDESDHPCGRQPRFAMASTLAGAIVNIILDPIFIFSFHWGMMGAAVATVLGQMVTAAASIWYLRRTKTVSLSGACFKPDFKIAGRALVLGICSFLSQISLVAAMAAINNMLRQIRRGGRHIRTRAVRADSDGRRWHRDEILSDRHLNRRRYGRRLYSDCRL